MDQFWIILRLIKIFNVKDFVKWMKEFHNKNDESFLKKCYPGIHFILRQLLFDFLKEFWEENTFEFEKQIQTQTILDSKASISPFNIFGPDKTSTIYLSDIEPIDELSKILLKIKKLMKNIIKAKDFNELNTEYNLFIGKIALFYKIYQDEIIFTDNNQQKEAYLEFRCKEYILRYNNVDGGSPRPNRNILRDEKLSIIYLEIIFIGYKFGVQFLWKKLLKEQFEKCIIKNLHEAENQFDDLKISPLDMIFQVYRDSKERLEKAIKIRKKWLSLDKYFKEIWDNLIKPLFKNFNITKPIVFFSENHFAFKDDNLLKKKSLKNRIINTLNITIEDMKEKVKKIYDVKSLEQEFYYKPVTILHFNYKRDFEGYLTFKKLLLGTLQLKNINNYKDEIILKRIKHKTNSSDIFFYSYAILLNESGWFVFYHLGTDNPIGTSNDYRVLIEKYIKEMKSFGDFKIETFEVDSELLITRYLYTLTQSYNLEKFGSIFLSEFKGSFLELLVYYYLTKVTQYNIYWSEKIKSLKFPFEFDLVYKDNGEILHLIECKKDLHETNVEKILNRIQSIKSTILEDKNFKAKVQIKEDIDFILEIWIWDDDPFFKYKKTLDSHPKISIIKFQDLFMHLELEKERRQKNKNLMNFEVELDDLDY